MVIKLFLFKDGNLVINKTEILTVPEFRTILTRDRGSVGDHDGRKKKQAFKEFSYIYHMADVNSTNIRNGISGQKAVDNAKSWSGLDTDYRADEVVNKAIAKYKELQYSLPRETIYELVKTYGVINTVIKGIRKNIEELATKDKLTVDQANDALNMINTLITQGENLPKLTTKLVTAIGQLERLEEKENRELIRGTNDLVPASADPDRRY